MARVLICDEKWYQDNYNDLDKIEYEKIVVVDYKNKEFSSKIFKEITSRKEDEICIVGSENRNFKSIDQIIKFTRNNHNVATIKSPGLGDFDFSQLSKKSTIVCFNSSLYNNNTIKTFSDILELQKYFIDISINSNKHYLYILNDSLKFKKVETDEKKRIKNTRRKKKNSNLTDISKIKKNSKYIDSKPTNIINKGKPKILIMCDVTGWAWWIKSEYLYYYLSNYYDIDIRSAIGGHKGRIDFKSYDICFTYGYSYVSNIMKSNFNRRVAGVTAHRPIDAIVHNLSKAKWLHANSILLYNEISEIFNNVFYVPNGVDEKRFYPMNDIMSGRDEMVFGHVGKLSPNKGQKEIIEPAIKKAGVRYFSHYNNYKKKVSHEDMPMVHHNYDVFICASDEDGTPCPALEAAACGRPIISNRIGNMPELIENYENGILLDSKNVDDYVDAIKWCQDNPDKVKKMGERVRKKIEEEWTWKLMSRNYLYMFDSILGINRDLSYYENPALYHLNQ